MKEDASARIRQEEDLSQERRDSRSQAEQLHDRKWSETSAKIVVVGVGNMIHSDDGAGVHALKRLQADPRLPSDVTLIDGGTHGIELLAYLHDSSRLLLLDAVDVGEQAGTLVRMAGASCGAFLAAQACTNSEWLTCWRPCLWFPTRPGKSYFWACNRLRPIGGRSYRLRWKRHSGRWWMRRSSSCSAGRRRPLRMQGCVADCLPGADGKNSNYITSPPNGAPLLPGLLYSSFSSKPKPPR